MQYLGIRPVSINHQRLAESNRDPNQVATTVFLVTFGEFVHSFLFGARTTPVRRRRDAKTKKKEIIMEMVEIECEFIS